MLPFRGAINTKDLYGAVPSVIGGGANWTPVGADNLILWYYSPEGTTLFQDAARTTPAAIGEAVGGVADLSGVGNHASITLTQRPLRAAEYLDFDGSNDKLSTLLALPATFTIYFAFKMNSFRASATFTDCLLSSYSGAGAVAAGEIIFRVFGATKNWYFIWGGRPTVNGGTPDTANHVATLVGGATTTALYIDNVLIDSDVHAVSTTSAAKLQIGEDVTDPGGAVDYADMNVKGLLIYSVAHTAPEMVNPYNYLATGWTI